MTPNYWHAQLTQLAAAALPSPSPNAATAVSPHWKDVVTAANDTLRTRAILIGGAFAYFKYLRGRIHYASLALSLEPIVIEIDKRRALSITTTITNSGTYQMVADMGCRQRVSLRCLDRLAELSPRRDQPGS